MAEDDSDTKCMEIYLTKNTVKNTFQTTILSSNDTEKTFSKEDAVFSQMQNIVMQFEGRKLLRIILLASLAFVICLCLGVMCLLCQCIPDKCMKDASESVLVDSKDTLKTSNEMLNFQGASESVLYDSKDRLKMSDKKLNVQESSSKTVSKQEINALHVDYNSKDPSVCSVESKASKETLDFPDISDIKILILSRKDDMKAGRLLSYLRNKATYTDVSRKICLFKEMFKSSEVNKQLKFDDIIPRNGFLFIFLEEYFYVDDLSDLGLSETMCKTIDSAIQNPSEYHNVKIIQGCPDMKLTTSKYREKTEFLKFHLFYDSGYNYEFEKSVAEILNQKL